MSEYWKSTPKYWCKFCKVFVKDTKLERQQHDATPRHQGNIQRSLRSLHRDKEQEDRQKQRAKDEVARLNGVVTSGGGASSGTTSTNTTSSAAARNAPPKQATLEERKRQMKQLADMGVAVPDEFRREMGMAGDWQTVKVTRVERPPTDEDSKDAVAFGVRKRKFEDQEEEEAILGTGDAEAAEVRKNRSWGARMKKFPGSGKKGGNDDDLDALLGGVVVKKPVIKEEGTGESVDVLEEGAQAQEEKELPALKKSDSDEEQVVAAKLGSLPHGKSESDTKDTSASAPAPGAGIVFKKRKKVVK